MNIGMLWFDNDSSVELTRKVKRAATYYRNKYGKTPTLCFVHPSMLPVNGNGGSEESGDKKEFMAAGLEVRSTQTLLPNHFWIGVNGVGNGNGSAAEKKTTAAVKNS